MKFYVFILLTIGFLMAGFLMRRSIKKKIERCVNAKDYKTMLKILDSLFVKVLFQPYQVELMRLNTYLSLNDKAKIDEEFSILLSARKSVAQTQQLVLRAFVYYIKEKDKDKCSDLMELIENFNDETIKKQMRIMYDTYILKGSRYIHILLEELDKTEDQNRGPIAYMIALQYENAGNKQKAEDYKKISRKIMSAALNN